ncbi:S9 family peptidase [Thermomonas brevis]|uniref:S9 family peptidase n=1 Tax=Thermomonas brevis TaxID=215691 RepID=A0A7G9QVL0_9GAMM|nr:prolyl oligopeptidase family serine peptidase [Thermomonas brevis]QNN47385.1 S9 family peptidase [Thermomonas brevis]
MTFPKLLGALACSVLLWAATPARADDAQALRTAVAAARARAPAPQYPRAAFEASRALQSVRLSPDGRHVAYLRQLGQQRSLWLLPTAGGAARQLLPRTEAEELYWSRDGRWLFAKASRTLMTLEIGGRGGMRIALDNPRGMLRVDPSQPAAVVLRERVRTPTGERWRVVRRDARGKRTLLWEDPRFIHDVALDARGRLVALMRFDGDHDALYRVEGNGRLREALRWTVIRDQAQLLAVTPQGDLLLDSDAGGNFRRVLRLDRDNVLHTVHADPRGEADLDQVALDPATQQPVVASYRSIVAATYGIGAAQAQVAAITRQFPDRDVGISIGNGPGARWLVSERAGTLRDARWHLYDPRNGRFRRILEQEAKVSPPPPETALARKLPFAYRASDGMLVHGFLLLPPGADPARVPLVAQVHGGPINHFHAGDYDGIAQLLANRGYAVFESNFRGSTGHGRDYALSPHGDYGNGRVQQDIVEGVRWLLAQGIGDPQRVGIVGHSFGGYSTLLGVTFDPELFKVGVAGAPPADFGWSMRWLHEFGNQGARPDRSLTAQLRLLGVDVGDAASYAHLRAQSPLANAGKLRRPLLLLAGGEDRTVPIREVIHYAAVLRRLGKDVSLYVEADGGHSPTEPLPREAYVYLMEAMLHRYLGGAKPEPPSPALHDYLKPALRIVDKDADLLSKR